MGNMFKFYENFNLSKFFKFIKVHGRERNKVDVWIEENHSSQEKNSLNYKNLQ